MRFSSDVDGTITGIRFYKGSLNTGTHVGHLWTAGGQLLATATFQNETASGWQQVDLSSAVAIAANTTYVVSYYAPVGRYSANGGYFGSPTTNGPLTAPSSGATGGNGVYRYGGGGGFPNQTYNSTNYWVDVVMRTTITDTVPPAVVNRSPAPGATAVDGKGSNSPYSAALAKAIENDRVPLEQLFRQVRVDVMAATGEDQVPWDASSLTGEFYFKRPDGSAPGGSTSAQQTAAAAPAPASQPAAQGASTSRSPEPAIAPGKAFRDCPDCPELVSIPAGSFTMGSPANDEAGRSPEKPQVKVTIARPFALMTTEVTRDQYAAFVKDTQREPDKGCYLPDGGDGKYDDKADFLHPGIKQEGNHPVVCVSWSDAHDYAEWLSAKTGKRYRLPSEAERDYAARGAKKTTWIWGEDSASANGCKIANVFDKDGKAKYPINDDLLPCSDNFAETGPVNAFPANGFGLKGMIGNVWEWVEDCYHETYQGAPTDGSAWEEDSCEKRVLRGSSYIDNVWDSRFASRDMMAAGDRNTNVGFRLARDF